MESLTVLKVILLVIVLGSLVGIGLSGIINSAQEFFKLANELEEEIKTKDNYEHQVILLMKLHSKSFHRNTASRLRELAKMMEVKYNVNLLSNSH